MPLDDKKQPIIIKKIKKHGHGHHGGAWKVAYADFVTAMMAFFLLMWLLGSTARAERAGISDFFKDPSAIQGPGGASTSMIKLGGSMEVPRGKDEPLKNNPKTPKISEKEALQDKARLNKLMEALKEQIENSPALQAFKDQLLLDITSEGLRIQIVDKKGRPMFDLGSSQLKSYTKVILHEIARTINKVPNHISISGHTDATPFTGERPDYTNWELSADRANAARRELIAGGMSQEKIGRVVGLASSVPFNNKDPYDPMNRRISIVVLNKATEQAIGLDGGKDAAASKPTPPPATEPKSAAPAPGNVPAEPKPAATAAGTSPASGSAAGDPMAGAIERALGPPPGR